MQIGLLTTAAVALQLGVSKSSISRDAAAHSLGKFVGNQKLFSASDVRKLMRIRREKKNSGNSHKKVLA